MKVQQLASISKNMHAEVLHRQARVRPGGDTGDKKEEELHPQGLLEQGGVARQRPAELTLGVPQLHEEPAHQVGSDI